MPDVITWSKRAGHSASLARCHLPRSGPSTTATTAATAGEGAGFLVLESSAPKPLAFLRGTGAANDATGMTAADTSGLSARYAIERSLADAQLPLSAIGLINAHGSATQMNDLTEKNALNDLFREAPRPLVFATKGNFGHSLGSHRHTGSDCPHPGGPFRSAQVPPIYGLDEPDAGSSSPLARARHQPSRTRFGISLTLGFGGFDTSLIFEAA